MYNIFISHSWDHLDDLKGLRLLLNNRGYFNVEFEEFTPENPINSTNIDYMKQRIRDHIRKSDVVIGMAGVYASYAKADNVETMKKLQKLASIGFIEPIGETHMYFAAMNSKSCKLTDLGMYYWLLVKRGRV